MEGTRLGPYEIETKLGEGGMGAVYLATDPRLSRKVAIKILPEEFAGDPDRLARFEREARAAAALNHPHIAAVFDIGVEGETRYIVQEYLQGEDLRARLDSGRVPLKTALVYAAEVAEALAVAHDAGIAHRDLKPENLFVSEQGHAKVLDFGLAKLTERAASSDRSATQSPTVLATSAGQIMGTAGYMAPEQIAGEDVDARADIFAFGCVLYEMVSGKRAFAGKNLPEVLHRLANEDPVPLGEVTPDLPAELVRITNKCLAKEASRRYQGAADIAVDLRGLVTDIESGRAVSGAGVAGETVAVGSRLPTLAVAVALGAVLGAAALWLAGDVTPATRETGATAYLPLRDVPGLGNTNRSQMAISPDSRYLAFAAGDGPARLWDMGAVDGERLVGETDGATVPFFSPDGHWFGYAGVDGRLYRVPVEGGRPQPFTEPLPHSSTMHADWTAANGLLVAGQFLDPTLRIAAIGATPEVLLAVAPDEQGQGTVSILPDGDHVIFSYWNDRWRVGVASLSTGVRTELTQGFGARYVPTGHLVWILAQQLMASTFDPVTLELGEPVQLLTAVAANPGWGRPAFDFNEEGTFAYLQGPATQDTAILRLRPDGSREVLRPAEQSLSSLSISPDGNYLGVTLMTVDGDSQIWSYDILRDDLIPIGQGAGWDQYPFFLNGGRDLAYASERNRAGDIYARSVDGVGAERQLSFAPPYRNEPHANSAGDIAAQGVASGEANAIWVFQANDLDAGVPFAASRGLDDNPQFSPDSAFLAYDSNRSGTTEVYVAPYPAGSSEYEWKVTTNGGERPRWEANSRALFYAADGAIWRVPVTQTSPFQTGVPELFVEFDGSPVGWDVAPDGRSIIAIEDLAPPRPQLILNWFDELTRRLPPR
jgi:serine/threonine-protein kinase